MTASNWEQQFAPFGLAVIGGLLLLVALLWPDEPGERHYAYAQKGCAAYQFDRFAAEHPSSREQRADRSEQREESAAKWCDLAAQESMARSTVRLKWAAWVSIAISIPGLVMLGYTLYYTRRAVDAALEANSINGESARNSDRAYIAAESVRLTWRKDASNQPSLLIEIRNSGKTPALWYGYRLRAFPSQLPPAPFDRSSIAARELVKWHGVPPETVRSFQVQTDELHSASMQAYADDVRLRVDGEVVYETFFGEKFVSEFSFSGFVKPQRRGAASDGGVGMSWFPELKLRQTTQSLRCFHEVERKYGR